jgi:ribonuclease HII
LSRIRPSLVSLRESFRAAVEEPEIEALIGRLESDERVGAQQLRAQALRRLEAGRAERERIARLLELRDELALRGARGIAGVDEVGVGPLAGPVVAAAVVLPEKFSLQGLDDSKRVRPARRESLAAEIRDVAIGFGIGEVRVEEIDQVGIYQAALEAMRRAVKSLERTVTIDHVLVDARTIPGVPQPQTSIIKGDQKDASIAAASIVAKVYRDGLMTTLGHRYPAYGFEQHMGYGTEAHMAALERVGPCPAHRRSFAPVERAERRIASRASRSTPGR